MKAFRFELRKTDLNHILIHLLFSYALFLYICQKLCDSYFGSLLLLGSSGCQNSDGDGSSDSD